jgi:hypothetical protein
MSRLPLALPVTSQTPERLGWSAPTARSHEPTTVYVVGAIR